MALSEPAPINGPKIVFLADSVQHGAHATTARVGDFLGVVGTSDTFVRGPDAWHQVHIREVERSFHAIGSIGIHKVPRAPLPPYSAVPPPYRVAAERPGKATLP